MKFLADENFPRPSLLQLRDAGFTIKSIQEEFPGIDDNAVVEIAENEKLIILTFDSDYGEILFKYGRKKPPSVIYFRFKGKSPNEAGKLLLELFNTDIQIEGYFTVIEEDGVRQRKI